jgi:excisionase family DNA binding protein
MHESTPSVGEVQPLNAAGESKATRPVEREWLTYREAESYCGLSRTTLWKLEKAGEIRAARIGRAVRLSKRSIAAYMESLADYE